MSELRRVRVGNGTSAHMAESSIAGEPVLRLTLCGREFSHSMPEGEWAPICFTCSDKAWWLVDHEQLEYDDVAALISGEEGGT